MTTRGGRAFKTLHDRIARLEEINKKLLGACKGAIAALTQNKTYPADIEATKRFLSVAISKTERKE